MISGLFSNRALPGQNSKLQLAIFGALTGLVAGLGVCLFRFVLEYPFPWLGPSGDFDSFEALSVPYRVILPLGGTALLILLFHFFPATSHSLGVTHVIDKVQNLKGQLPIQNALLQFLGAATALLTGHSCGREGPSIHLGATCGSLLGRWLQLPNNSNRILIACGAAAAIAAAFNTPIAGVVFVMEVILMEYTIVEFIPVIIAAVSGTVISQILYGSNTVFIMEEASMNTLWELPYVVFIGLVIGTLASAFILIQRYCLSFVGISLTKRLLAAGLLTALFTPWLPQVMGAGYDTINAALQSEFDFGFLLILLLSKLFLTAVVLGLGLPGGVIGPSLVLGGLAGAFMGLAGNAAITAYAATPAFYVLLGMCAMMGAVLQAPLAALMAVLELSGNPELILPAMLVIVVANLTTSELFKLQSITQISLQHQGIVTPKTLGRILNRYNVNVVLDKDFTLMASVDLENLALPTGPVDQTTKAPEKKASRWIVLRDASGPLVLESARLTQLLTGFQSGQALAAAIREAAQPMVEIPAQSTLNEALELLDGGNLDFGLVLTPLHLGRGVLGLVRRDEIVSYYRNT